MSSFIILLCMMMTGILVGQEICDNGIDDDGDTLIDLNDDDCPCLVTSPVSLILNPSFEDMECCPSERSELDCASHWIQASEPTTDFIHTCDWLGWDNFPPPRPFPDGEGIMGFRDGRVRSNDESEAFWKEYAGACLTSPLLKDTVYTFQFDVGFVDPEKSPPIDITFFGTHDCEYLPFGQGDEAFGCPSNDPNWQKLAEVRVSGGAGNVWVNEVLVITPVEDIYAIAIGPDCEPVPTENSIYYFFDNLILASLASFDLQVREDEHPCDENFSLSVPYNEIFSYQWYLNGVAIQGETFSKLSQDYGEGSYQVRIDDGVSCRVSVGYEFVIPVFENPVDEFICTGDTYPFGDRQLTETGSYIDTFKNVNNCDSIVFLELGVIGQKRDTFEKSILAGETFELAGSKFSEVGEYTLLLPSSLGCDSLVLLQLNHFDIYTPNIFSPNFDGVNDVFRTFGPEGKITAASMQIFDRWGNLIFEGESWDGNGYLPGVYVYVLRLEFSYGGSTVVSGDITLAR